MDANTIWKPRWLVREAVETAVRVAEAAKQEADHIAKEDDLSADGADAHIEFISGCGEGGDGYVHGDHAAGGAAGVDP